MPFLLQIRPGPYRNTLLLEALAGQDNRFIATNQALEILMRRTDGKFRKNVSKKDLVRAHYLLLAILSISGLLLETTVEVMYALRSEEDAKMSEVHAELKPNYQDLFTVSF